MKVIVISGFLGSGKTTFIESFAKHLDRLAIIENDFARANIDLDILSQGNDNVYSLEDGCICCSKRNDFATSILTIANTINPDYLLVEPTGVGYLSKVITNINKIAYEAIEILEPICIVDYHTIDDNLTNNKELFLDQIQNAGHILLSKTENISNKDIDIAIDTLSEHTKAIIHKDHYKSFSSSDFEQLMGNYDIDTLIQSNSSDIELEQLKYDNISFDSFQSCGTVFNAICQCRFGKILRAKGFIDVADKTVKIDIVGSSFNIEKYRNDVNKSLVFLGKNLDKRAFDILFNKK